MLRYLFPVPEQLEPFIIQLDAWLAATEICRGDIFTACVAAWEQGSVDGEFLRVDKDAFAQCPKDSIDYAVMERLASSKDTLPPGVVIPLSAGWSDVGAWDALWEVLPKNEDGNVIQGDVVMVGSHNTLAISEGRLLACLGVDDMIVVQTPDAVLVAATGGPAVLPQITLQEKGYKGRIYQTHGVATNDFIRIGGKAVEGTLMAGGPMLVAYDLPGGSPIKAIAQGYIKAYETKYGAGTMSTFGANTYDAGLLLQKAIPTALKKAKPGSVEFREALRDALEQSKEVVGAQGVFNMSAQNHNGMDQRARVMMTVKDGKWVLIKD